jgi:solute carrier family 25 carnitine/acylcarnitine transporter 20/29
VRDASASVMYFSFYELMKVALCEVPGLSADGKVNFGGVLVAGGVAGVMNWCPAIPFDVCKTRLQVAPEGKYSGAIFGSTSVLKEVWAEGGLKALYRGTLPIFVRAVPANAACFCGFEVCMDALTKAGMP